MKFRIWDNEVNYPPPIEAGASCFHLWYLQPKLDCPTEHNPQALFGLARQKGKATLFIPNLNIAGKYRIGKSVEIEFDSYTLKEDIDYYKHIREQLNGQFADWEIADTGKETQNVYKNEKSYLKVKLVKYVDEKPESKGDND